MTWYQDLLVDTGRAPAFWLLIGFVLTFVATRAVTRRIRTRAMRERPDRPRGRRVLADIHIAGVHVHHQVWGILLVLVVGLVHFRFDPSSPWLEVLALLFGAGAALALDQFALWVHLDDVYWSEQGRKSIDAILVATAVAAAMVTLASPVGFIREQDTAAWVLMAALVVHFTLVVWCFLKGKRYLAVVGMVVPGLPLIGVLRLAKSTSFWAKRFYSLEKRARARHRFSHDYPARWNRLRDWIGGDHGVRLPRRLDQTITESLGDQSEGRERADEPHRSD